MKIVAININPADVSKEEDSIFHQENLGIVSCHIRSGMVSPTARCYFYFIDRLFTIVVCGTSGIHILYLIRSNCSNNTYFRLSFYGESSSSIMTKMGVTDNNRLI
jgi:hypothetical protein